MSLIDLKYLKLEGFNGILGNPVTEELPIYNNSILVGSYRDYQYGTIYLAYGASAAFEVHGAIKAKFDKLGGIYSFLGFPTTDETWNANNSGKYNQFQRGSILWLYGAGEAFETHGAILGKWGQFNYELGILGFPVTDETTTPDTIGRFNHFQNGSIYWKPSISAHEIHGLLKESWRDQGWERNAELGYPISDVLPTKSKNTYSDFENGVLYLKNGTSKVDVLWKFPPASLTAEDIISQINTFIVPLVQAYSIKVTLNAIFSAEITIYFNNEPFIAEITDYSFDGNKVHNRRYKIHTDIGINIPTIFMPDIECNIDLWIEIDYDKVQRKVFAYLTWYSVHTHIPWPTSGAITADYVNKQFENSLNPVLWQPNQIIPKPGDAPIPENVNILSLKIMLNGDLNVYMEPLCAVTTACMASRGLGDDCEELQTLRLFRENYVSKLPKGKKLIDEYYGVAPQLVNSINCTKNPHEVYEMIYKKYISPITSYLSNKDYEKAFLLSQQAVKELKARYLD